MSRAPAFQDVLEGIRRRDEVEADRLAEEILARRFSAELRREPDEAFAAIEPDGPTAVSIYEEAKDTMAGFATAMLDLHRRAFLTRQADR